MGGWFWLPRVETGARHDGTPHWQAAIPLVPLAFIATVAAAFLHGRAGRLTEPGICRRCGYPLAGVAGDTGKFACPECGAMNRAPASSVVDRK